MTSCPNCGLPNADDARFCSNCGHALVSRVGVEERRHVTALFADLVASTALSDRLDPEVVRGVVSRFFERATEEVRRHGGSVEKFSGDAVMALFGLQQAHEDDPERAVRAAFAVRDALAVLAPDAAERHGIDLAVRIGIEAGEVVVGDPFGGATMATGDPLNLAARLEQHAAPGEIVVGPAAHDATARAIAYEPAGSWQLAGKSEPVPAWRAVGTRASPGDARGIEGHSAPLTGRDEELALLRDASRRVDSERKAVLFTILGVPGVGKSRLVRELAAQLGDVGWLVLRGRCLPYGEGITYWPLAEIVRGLADITPELSGSEALARLQSVAPDAATAERLAFAIGLTASAPVTGEALDREIAFAFRHLVEAAAGEHPTLLVVEDIHWAEPPLLDLLEYLATWVRERPVLIICLARPDLLDHRPSWGSGRMEASRLSLEPLTREEAASLVRSLLEVEGLPERVRDQVLDRAEGNPLFVEETIRMLIERRAVVERDGRWVAAEAIQEVEVPETIEALIRARLDALPREERSVLQGASVIGRVFQRSAVAMLMESPVEAQLEQAVLRDIVSEEPAEDPSYRFKHIVIRDVAYGTLPKARRAILHRRVVDWLDAWAGDRLDEFVEIEAYHLEQAVRLLNEIEGEADPKLVARAIASLRRGADKATSRDDLRGVISFADRALALGSASDEGRLEIEIVLLEALFGSGDATRGRSLAESVAARARAIDRKDVLGRALLVAGVNVWVGVGAEQDTQRGLTLLREARAVLREAGDLLHEADVAYWLGFEGWYLNDVESAVSAWLEAVSVARAAGDAARQIRVLLRLSGAYFELGRVVEADALLQEAEVLAPQTSRLTQGRLIRDRGIVLATSGADLAAGRQMMDEARRIGEEAGDLELRYLAGLVLAEIDLVTGDGALAAEELRSLVDLTTAAEHGGWMPEAERRLAQALLAEGEIVEAEIHAQRAVETVLGDDVYSVASTAMALGMVRDAQGRQAEAAALLAKARDISDALTFRAEQPEFDLSYAVFHLGNGRTEVGEALLAKAVAGFKESHGPRSPYLAYAERLAAEARSRAAAR